MHLLTKSRNLRAYCSGLTVDISALVPCFIVLAACAVRFLTPYRVKMSIIAKKYISLLGQSKNRKFTFLEIQNTVNKYYDQEIDT